MSCKLKYYMNLLMFGGLLFSIAVDVAHAEYIVQPTSIDASSTWGTRYASNCISGSGFSATEASLMTTGSDVPQDWPTHGTAPVYMADETYPTITFDLGQVYTISGFHLWNYNEPTHTARGVRTANITISSTGSSIVDSSDYSSIAFSQEMSIATGNGETEIVGENYYFPSTFTARYIRWNVTSNWGDLSYPYRSFTGISEIRFIAVPEPSSCILLCILGIALLGYRGQKWIRTK